MRNNFEIYFLVLVVIFFGCDSEKNESKQSLTGINPVSYTAVTYGSNKNEVFATTFNGCIYKLSNEREKELAFKIEDEIYSIQYFEPSNVAYVATYKSGVLGVDLANKKIINRLPVNNAWIADLKLSNNGRYLYGIDVKRNNHIWDVANNFEKIDVSKELPGNYIRLITDEGLAYFQTSGKYSVWDIGGKELVDEISTYGKLCDIDNQGNMVTVYDNQFIFYDQSQSRVAYSKKHPYYIYQEPNGDTIRDPYQLKILNAALIKDKIYTVGLDRTTRVWDKTSGNLIDEWVSNDATISGVDVSSDRTQIATVDLKGSLTFKNVGY